MIGRWSIGMMASGAGEYKNGKKDGTFIFYSKNGQLLSQGGYKNGRQDGPWVAYFENGRMESKSEYKYGMRSGPSVVYNYDRTVNEKNTGTFQSGVKISD